MAAPSPMTPMRWGRMVCPNLPTQTFGGKKSTVAQVCRQLEHDRCSMAWWLQARQQRRRAAANKEVAKTGPSPY
ncbi:hypothetical protein HaLaN_32882, partial [Haematococcus lacustris]